MKKFEEPAIQAEVFEVEDIITASGVTGENELPEF